MNNKNNDQNISLDELESLLIEGEELEKERIKVRNKTWRENNKEHVKAYEENYKKQKRANYEANKDEILAKNKIYREAHREEINIKAKKYYQDNKDKIKIKSKIYNNIHRDEILVKQKVYREKHKEEQKVYYEQKAKELGFENRAQKQRYDRWCRKNNIQVDMKNSEYLEKIQYWIKNIDKNK